MSRGDLSEDEWRILKDLLPIEPDNRGRGRPPEQNRSIINGIIFAAVPHGAICRPNMAAGTPSIAGSAVGARPAFGRPLP